jgi:hypothetical protein
VDRKPRLMRSIVGMASRPDRARCPLDLAGGRVRPVGEQADPAHPKIRPSPPTGPVSKAQVFGGAGGMAGVISEHF